MIKNALHAAFESRASGDLVIVEIDAKSLKQLNRWPWDRVYYAELVEKLNQAGAAMIAFDVDFSSASNSLSDARFSEALSDSSATIVLPTLRQISGTGRKSETENLPLQQFREHAVLASVNVSPDRRGQLNQLAMGTVIAGHARPSLAAILAGSNGNTRAVIDIDQAIDPLTIPRLSFVDVIHGAAKNEALAGKLVLVGSTAIELGDHFSTSRHGVLPGVVIQALGAETLMLGGTATGFGILPAMAVTAFCLFIWASARQREKVWASYSVGVMGCVLLVLSLAVMLDLLVGAQISMAAALASMIFFFPVWRGLELANGLEQSRLTDSMCGLRNERALNQTLIRKPDTALASLVIGNFTELAAVHGSDAGHDLLRKINHRLSVALEGEEVCRVGEDVLAWTMHKCDKQELEDMFASMSALLRPSFEVGNAHLKVECHFGYAECHPGFGGEKAIEDARTAARQAHSGQLRWAMKDEGLLALRAFKQQLLMGVDAALEEEQFRIVYQPKFNIAAGKVTSAEALMRWEHPEHGLIRPDLFIPVLEDSGHIADATLFAIESALDAMKSWNGVGCAVNISARLLGDRHFIDRAVAMTRRSGLTGLTFEITESAAVADPDAAKDVLTEISRAGIGISIDDYGTGQSTLTYLRNFPANEIKIDQSFVRSMGDREADRILVQSSIELAHALGFKVVAEGVEDGATLQLLCQMGCDSVQGWHIGKPVSAFEFQQNWASTIPAADNGPPLRLTA